MKKVGIKRGVVIAMNPQTGEVLALVSLPTYDNNQFARGISNKDYAKLLKNPDKPLLNHATQAHYPPGSTYKLVAGTGALADKKITAEHEGPDGGLPDARFDRGSTTGTTAASARATSTAVSATRATRSSSRWRASSGSTAWATGRSSTASAARPGSTSPARSPGSSRRTSGSRTPSARKVFAGETYQAGIGQGYDVVTPIQLINAYAALANGGTLYQPQIVRDIVGPDGTVVRPFKPKVIRKMKAPASVLKVMRNAARSTVTLRHTYNLVDMPIKVAGKSGTAEFGTVTARAGCRSTRGSSGFVPKDARHGSFNGTGCADRGPRLRLRLADEGQRRDRDREVLLQLHFGIKKDYRLPDLLKRGNFYQSN